MTYQVTAPRLLFLYPRVARLSLSPDTRGQLIFPHLIEQDKVTTLTQCKGKRSRRNCNQPLGDATDTIGSGGSFTKSNNGKARCTASGARMCPSSWRLGFRERSGSTRAGGISKEKRIHTSAGCQQSIKPKRYGTANEPPPYLENSKRKDENGRRRVKKEAEERGQKRGANDNAEEKEGSTKKDTTAIKGGAENRDGKNNQRVSRTAPGRQHLYRADGRLVETNLDNEGDADEESPVVHEKSQAQILQSKQTGIGNNIDSSNGADHLQTHRETNDDYTTQEALLQTFLQAQPSEMLDKASQQLLLRNNRDAHLSSSNSSPASHFHHFDTYTMARNLQDGGFSEKQAVTTMKAMRVTLAENLDWAKKGLVSKSNVENGTYLFRAACSELRTEVQHNRKKAADRMRNERNQLEREAEILNQRFQQESQNLKDELRGMFDDRKMAVRMDQKAMESKIQELDYTITVALRSDARSAVEGLRWILVRRAAIAIVISAVMILATLRYSSYMSRTQELERQKMEAGQPIKASYGNSADHDPSDNSPLTGHPPIDTEQTSKDNVGDEEILVRAQEGGGPGYISLG